MQVSLFMSEWIEIKVYISSGEFNLVSLFMSEWIEMPYMPLSSVNRNVSLFMSEWIEIQCFDTCFVLLLSLTLYE